MSKTNYRTLKANDRMLYGDTYHYDVQGKEHIIDDARRYIFSIGLGMIDLLV